MEWARGAFRGLLKKGNLILGMKNGHGSKSHAYESAFESGPGPYKSVLLAAEHIFCLPIKSEGAQSSLWPFTGGYIKESGLLRS